MFRPTLGTTLLNIAGAPKMKPERDPLLPSTPTAFFIEKGHIMEFLSIRKPAKRMIALFFGPGEFVVRCHHLSELVSLDNVKGNPFTHGVILQTLRKFPEIHLHYREMRKRYQEKVNDRLLGLQTMTDQERYQQLKTAQPWVFKLADPDDIASYLFISRQVLQDLSK